MTSCSHPSHIWTFLIIHPASDNSGQLLRFLFSPTDRHWEWWEHWTPLAPGCHLTEFGTSSSPGRDLPSGWRSPPANNPPFHVPSRTWRCRPRLAWPERAGSQPPASTARWWPAAVEGSKPWCPLRPSPIALCWKDFAVTSKHKHTHVRSSCWLVFHRFTFTSDFGDKPGPFTTRFLRTVIRQGSSV